MSEVVVVDPGSKFLKAGLASSALIGHWYQIIPTKMKRVAEDGDLADISASEEVTVDPIVRGFVRDWDVMEDLLHYVLYTRIGWNAGDEGQVLFADSLWTTKAAREQLVQMMFETFNVSGFYTSEQTLLALYAVGRFSGCTVDIGHGKLDIAPIREGSVLQFATKRFEIGGTDLTEILARELRKTNTQVEVYLSVVEKLKEQYACCAPDETAFEESQISCQKETHTLPDGQVITLGKERFAVGEALFQPPLLGLEMNRIVEQLVQCISSVALENHRDLLVNTLLCGGTASMTGFKERFQKEASLRPSSIRPSLIETPEYMPESFLPVWVGGSIVAQFAFPHNQQMTKGEYDEMGPAFVHRKCFF